MITESNDVIYWDQKNLLKRIFCRFSSLKNVFLSFFFAVTVPVPIPPQRPWIPLARPNRTRPACKYHDTFSSSTQHIIDLLISRGWRTQLKITLLCATIQSISFIHTIISATEQTTDKRNIKINFVSFSGIFTVMCYNVLCDKYATRQMYGYCPSWALNWDYRKKVRTIISFWQKKNKISIQNTMRIYRTFVCV